MTPPVGPAPYRVIYSGRVRDALRDLAARARALGIGRDVLAALAGIEHRLAVYPQFGEPLRDLAPGRGVEWVGFVGPLAVHYVLLEDLRQVWVVRPVALSNESRLPPAG